MDRLRDRALRRLRRGAPEPHPLGEGLWRADFERVDRASRRVLQVLELGHLDDAPLVAQVRACREAVWRCCLEAVARDPAADRDVPRDDDLAAAHRAVSRAATAVAQVAQALVMAAGDPAAAARAAATATARADEAATALGLRPRDPGDPAQSQLS